MIRSLCAILTSTLILAAAHAPAQADTPADTPAKIDTTAKVDRHFKGQPFPIVVYGVVQRESLFKWAREWGATHIHRYGMGRSIEQDQAYFDLAAKHGLKLMADLDGRRTLNGENGEDGLAHMRQYVNHFKDHPAMGFWYLYDEPDNHNRVVDDVRPYYEMIKAQTPDIPIAVAHAWTTNWYKFNGVQDILMNDIYPVTGAPFPEARLNVFTRFTEGALRSGNAVIPVLQLFNWKAMAKKDQAELRGYPVEELRHPNPVEMRYMTMASIAMGARGLSYYSHARGAMVGPEWMDDVAKPTVTEAKAFAKAFIEPGNMAFTRQRRAEDDDMYLSLWEGDRTTAVILINAWPQARKIRRNIGKTIAGNRLKPWGYTRDANATINNGQIVIEEAQPWEVFIWTVESR